MFFRLFAALRGLAYAALFVWLWWWVVRSARPYDARLGFALPDWLRLPGLWIAAGGAVLALSCVVAFALVGRGTPAPFDAPREFVAVGPYRWVRNPMYLGAMTVIVGAGLALRSPAALGVALLFFVLAHAFVLLYEEPAHERRFGESYRRYLAAVPRWLPRPPRASDTESKSLL
jgi:protein-S-isoprenylcysteine O-methyltransferase Ste14